MPAAFRGMLISMLKRARQVDGNGDAYEEVAPKRMAG